MNLIFIIKVLYDKSLDANFILRYLGRNANTEIIGHFIDQVADRHTHNQKTNHLIGGRFHLIQEGCVKAGRIDAFDFIEEKVEYLYYDPSSKADHSKIKTEAYGRFAIIATKKRNWEMLYRIVGGGIDCDAVEYIIPELIKERYYEQLERFIQDERILEHPKISFIIDNQIKMAIEESDAIKIYEIFKKDKRYSPIHGPVSILNHAASNGRYKLLETILDDKRVFQPSAIGGLINLVIKTGKKVLLEKVLNTMVDTKKLKAKYVCDGLKYLKTIELNNIRNIDEEILSYILDTFDILESKDDHMKVLILMFAIDSKSSIPFIEKILNKTNSISNEDIPVAHRSLSVRKALLTYPFDLVCRVFIKKYHMVS